MEGAQASEVKQGEPAAPQTKKEEEEKPNPKEEAKEEVKKEEVKEEDKPAGSALAVPTGCNLALT